MKKLVLASVILVSTLSFARVSLNNQNNEIKNLPSIVEVNGKIADQEIVITTRPKHAIHRRRHVVYHRPYRRYHKARHVVRKNHHHYRKVYIKH